MNNANNWEMVASAAESRVQTSTASISPLGDSLALPAQSSGNAVAAAAAVAQRVAEVRAALEIAKACPRNEQQALDRLLNACQRTGLAAAATYTYARGGQNVSGASIRLAEAAARAWGNVEFGFHEVERGATSSKCVAFCWDKETNVKSEREITVSHVRHTRQGATLLRDDRDIREKCANETARAVRACILAIIPGDIIEEAIEQCARTLAAKADVSPEGIKKLVAAFEALGVSRAQIEKRIQRRIDGITASQVVALRSVFNAIKDGLGVVADYFEPEAKAEEEKPKGATLRGAIEMARVKAAQQTVDVVEEAKE